MTVNVVRALGDVRDGDSDLLAACDDLGEFDVGAGQLLASHRAARPFADMSATSQTLTFIAATTWPPPLGDLDL
jgi:hypothetical protein